MKKKLEKIFDASYETPVLQELTVPAELVWGAVIETGSPEEALSDNPGAISETGAPGIGEE